MPTVSRAFTYRLDVLVSLICLQFCNDKSFQFPQCCAPPPIVPVPFLKAKLKQDLFGLEICYRDPWSGNIIACTVKDCVTSRLRGELFVLMYDDGQEVEVSTSRMQEILSNRVG
jgi:hypothetical protein